MRFRSLTAAGFALSLASVASAQTPAAQCPGGAPLTPEQIVQDACQQVVDIFKYMLPQIGISMVGANTTMGQGGTLGGFPHFALGIRGNVVDGQLPVPQVPSTVGAVQRPNYETKLQLLGLPAVDLAVGIFKGFPLALSNVGGIDLLVSGSYLPEYSVDTDDGTLSILPDNPVQLGYGARIGLLQESLLMPGIGVSFILRDLPKTTFTGQMADDSLIVRDMEIKTLAWRVTASKSLVLFSVGLGVGQDTYDAKTAVSAVVNDALIGRVEMPEAALSEKVTRTNYFAELSFNLLLARIVGTFGRVSGGSIDTFSGFATPADASRLYGSVGVRFGF
jgi:hypothetical protein